jgi:hypothetical protein
MDDSHRGMCHARLDQSGNRRKACRQCVALSNVASNLALNGDAAKSTLAVSRFLTGGHRITRAVRAAKTETFNVVRLSAHPTPSRIKVRKSGPYLAQHRILNGEPEYDTRHGGSMRTKEPWTPITTSMT